MALHAHSRSLARAAAIARALALLGMLLSNVAPLAAAPASLPATQPAPAAPNVSATMTDAVATDRNGNGRADAGDTLRYTAVVSNTGRADATDVVVSAALDPATSFVPGSLRASPLAFADSYTALRNTPRVVAAPGVLANDTGLPAPAVAPGSRATAAGGTVVIAADGGFTYTPPANYTGADSFTYSASNALGSDSATVSISAEGAPRVVSTSPAEGAVNVPGNASFTVTFDEPVNPAAGAFTLACPAPVALTVSPAAPAVTFTLTPSTPILASAACTLTVVASLISDDDNLDPPDTLEADYVVHFSTADPAPAVLSVTPADGASGVGTNVGLSVTFSEPVNAASGAFALACPAGTPVGVAVSGGPTAFTVTPTASLPQDTSCTLTVSAAQVTDQDGVDPPDAMAADFVSIFRTDAAPAVASTTPANNATAFATSANLSVTFSEPVNAASGAFALECPTGSPIALAVSGGPTSFTLDPTSDLPPTTSCTLTVIAAQVTDQDAGDPPDAMAADLSVTFATADPAPSVTSAAPTISGPSGASTSTNLSVTFSEPVNAASGAFVLECPTGSAIALAVSGGPTSFTLDPTSDLPAAASCTLTVAAAQVTDQDSIDPPDTMAADYTATFSTDAAPSAAAEAEVGASFTPIPAAGLGNVERNGDLRVTFSEPVNVSGNWFAIACATSGARAVADTAVSGGPTTFTINPNADFAPGEACTLTVAAAQVSDQDGIDPPDTMASDASFTFTTADTAPTLASSSPSGVAPADTNIALTFSEPVNVTGGWFAISCSTSGARGLADAAVSGGPTIYTINPNADFASGETCSVTVLAAQVSDQDSVDPPNTLASNAVFSFSIDAAPDVASVAPANGASSVAVASDITVTFSEPVNVSGNWFAIACATSGARAVADTAVSGGPTTFTINPNADFAPGEACTLTVAAAQVSDQDGIDPPDTMASGASFTFTTADVPPRVTAAAPASGATNVATDRAATLTFSEKVDIAAGAFSWACGATPVSFTPSSALPASGLSSITLTPSASMPEGATCTLTVAAASVTDSDAADPPDQLDGNGDGTAGDDYTLSFTTDAAPTLVSSTPANGAVNVQLTPAIALTFSESVLVAGTSAFTLECPAGASVPFTVSPALPATGTSFTLTPSSPLPINTLCVVALVPAQISDADAGDPPDHPPATTFSFTTVDDTAPTVTSTTVDGAPTRASDATLGVTFSESVDVTTSSFTLSCGGPTLSYGLSATSGTSFTLTPSAALPAGASCTLVVVAAQVSDTDTIDPPDTMTANAVRTFSTDAGPSVTSTTVDGAPTRASDTTLGVTFSESVEVTTSSFTLSCGGPTLSYGLSATSGTSFTLTPSAALPTGANCTLVVVAAQVSDTDTIDPPDTMTANAVRTFSTDAGPSVTSTTVDGAPTRASDTTVGVTFSESVEVTTSSFTLSCGGPTLSYGLSATSGTSFTLTPSAALPAGANCTLVVVAAQVSDTDTIDPPDTMTANAVRTFSTDAAPTVVSAEAQVGGTFTAIPGPGLGNVDASTNLRVTFSESVSYNGGSFLLECPSGAAYPFAFTSTSPGAVATLDPTSTLPEGQVCTLTVVAAQVSDADAIDPPDKLAANVVYTFRVPPRAVSDNYSGVGNTLLEASVAPSGFPAKKIVGTVLDNDVSASALTASAGSFATAQGGAVTLNADGSFSYTPPVGFTGSDSFGYTITDANGSTATGTAQIVLSERVWYVRNNAAAGGSGRSSSPFNTLAAAQTASAANDYIFVHTGDGSTANMNAGITLKNGQQLIGEGVSLVVSGFTLLASGSRPQVGNAGGSGITLGQNNTVRGLNIANTTAAAISGNTFGTLTLDTVSLNTANSALSLNTGTANATFTAVTSTGGASNISLTSVDGTIALGSGALSGASNGVVINGGAASISYSGTIASAAGRPLDISTKSGGTVDLLGAVSGTAQGIRLSNNTGATINLAGGLTLNTTINTAFDMSGGGTLAITGASNTITTSSGQAVSIANSTIGASGVTFQRISTNGAANAITLNATGSGPFTVSGAGSTDGSGGVIQNSSGDGVRLQSANNVSLSNMQLTNAGTSNGAGPCDALSNTGCTAAIDMSTVSNITLTNVDITYSGARQNAINGTTVNGFTLSNSTVNNGGDQADEHNLRLAELTGTASILNTSITNGYDRNALIRSTSGALTLNVTGSTFNGTNATFGNDGLEVEAAGSAAIKLNVTSSTFSNNLSNGLQALAQGSGKMDVVVSGASVFTNNQSLGMEVAGNNTATFEAEVTGATFTTNGTTGINTFAGGASTGNVRIENNTITTGTDVGYGVAAQAVGTSNLRALIKGNTITYNGIDIAGVFVVANPGTSGQLDATIENNNVTATDPAATSFYVQATAGKVLCLNATGNVGTADPSSFGFVADRGGAAVFQIQGIAGTTASAAQSRLNSTNTLNPGAFAMGTFAAGTCNLPTFTQRAAAGQGPGAQAISQGELAPVVDAALARWQAAGLGARELAMLRAARVNLADLGDGLLGEAGAGMIALDRDAAGWGWYRDASPADDAEFDAGISGHELRAGARSPAHGRIDLLTVVMHEQGHLLGRSDIEPAQNAHDLMTDALETGARRLPEGAPATAAITSYTIGTLPAGKHIIVTFDATIAALLPPGLTQLSAQATITASGLAPVTSDDPRRPGASDPTVTMLRWIVALPLVVNPAAPAPLPDLVVDSITVADSSVEVVIRNAGAAPVTSAFWVDVYLEPRTAPTAANQIWEALGSHGAAWAITGSPLPLAPGARLTLRLGDQFFNASKSALGVELPAGALVYAQVDSANAGVPTGAVLETHERDGGAYNNIASIAVGASGVKLPAIPTLAANPPTADLPRR